MKIHLDNLTDIKFNTWQKRMQAYTLLKETGVDVSKDLLDLLKADCKNLLELAKLGKLKQCIEDNTPCDKAVVALQNGAQILNEIDATFYDEVAPFIESYYKKKKAKITKVAKAEIEQNLHTNVVTEKQKNTKVRKEKEAEVLQADELSLNK